MNLMYSAYVSFDFLLDDYFDAHDAPLCDHGDSFGFLVEVSELFHKIGKDQEKQSDFHPTTHHWI